MTRATLLYDDDCGFCRWALDRILFWDRRGVLEPMPLQSLQAAELLRDVDPAQRMASWHLVLEDGTVHSGGQAVAPLAKILPRGAPAALVAKRFPGAMNALYEWVAENRSRFAKLGLSAPKRASRRSPSRKAPSRR